MSHDRPTLAYRTCPHRDGCVPRMPCATDNELITTLQLAAIDLGSNSFRLEIGRADGGQIYVLDSIRSNVRLAAGLTADKRLTPEAMERGLEAIALFAQLLHGVQVADPIGTLY